MRIHLERSLSHALSVKSFDQNEKLEGTWEFTLEKTFHQPQCGVSFHKKVLNRDMKVHTGRSRTHALSVERVLIKTKSLKYTWEFTLERNDIMPSVWKEFWSKRKAWSTHENSHWREALLMPSVWKEFWSKWKAWRSHENSRWRKPFNHNQPTLE